MLCFEISIFACFNCERSAAKNIDNSRLKRQDLDFDHLFTNAGFLAKPVHSKDSCCILLPLQGFWPTGVEGQTNAISSVFANLVESQI